MPDVSRRHAEIISNEGGLTIADRSRNGILVNGKRVRSGRLAVGDVVQVASYTLRLEDDAAGSDQQAGVMDTETVTIDPDDLNLRAPADRLGEMLGSCETMKRVYTQIRQLANSSVTVLILGETGTGKELVARALHSLGSRGSKPIIPVNCAAISPELVESELFGHEKGAFTGALRRSEGAFEAARDGTLFLDEVGEMALTLQPKLLRVLETSEIVRVGGGGREPIPVRARLIAATNRDLAADVEMGRFRQDLYFRLCVVPIILPPLRERGEDVIQLAFHFMEQEGDGGHALDLRPDAKELLRRHPWPGNVRELRSVIRRLIAEGLRGGVDETALRGALQADRSYRATGSFFPPTTPAAGGSVGGEATSLRKKGTKKEEAGGGTLREQERLAIVRALEDSGGNKQEAARRLGISPSTLYEKLHRYNLLGS